MCEDLRVCRRNVCHLEFALASSTSGFVCFVWNSVYMLLLPPENLHERTRCSLYRDECWLCVRGGGIINDRLIFNVRRFKNLTWKLTLDICIFVLLSTKFLSCFYRCWISLTFCNGNSISSRRYVVDVSIVLQRGVPSLSKRKKNLWFTG